MNAYNATSGINNSVWRSLSPPVLYSQPLPDNPHEREISPSNNTSLTSIPRMNNFN